MEEYMIQSKCARKVGETSRLVDNVSISFTVDPVRVSMSTGKIFVIEDEAHVRKTVGLALKQGGYEVLEAADGEEAMAAIQSSSIDFSVQAIICDIGLPKVNGHDLIAFIRVQLPSVPIIVLTGHPDVQSAASLFKQGVVDYLVKPTQAHTLLDAVRRAIGEQAVFE
jgi:two-component system chemotaxis response regulator CheY